MSEDKPLQPISQLPRVLLHFSSPGWGGSHAAFSHQHSWNRTLGWALGSCPAMPGNLSLPHCFYCCCCLEYHLRHETTTSFFFHYHLVWSGNWTQLGSSPLGADGAGGAIAKASSPCSHICWLVLAVGWGLSRPLDWNTYMDSMWPGLPQAWWLDFQDECPQGEPMEAVLPYLTQPLK